MMRMKTTFDTKKKTAAVPSVLCSMRWSSTVLTHP